MDFGKKKKNLFFSHYFLTFKVLAALLCSFSRFLSVSSLKRALPQTWSGYCLTRPCELKDSHGRKTPSVGRALNERSKGGVADTGAESSVFILEMHAGRLAKAEGETGPCDILTWPTLGVLTRRPPTTTHTHTHTGDAFFPTRGRVVQVTQPRGQRNGRLQEETGGREAISGYSLTAEKCTVPEPGQQRSKALCAGPLLGFFCCFIFF